MVVVVSTRVSCIKLWKTGSVEKKAGRGSPGLVEHEYPCCVGSAENSARGSLEYRDGSVKTGGYVVKAIEVQELLPNPKVHPIFF